MIRRSVSGFAVIELEVPAPEELLRWVRDLPDADPQLLPDVRWQTGGDNEANRPWVARGDNGMWECRGRGHHLLAMTQDVALGRSATLVHGCGLEFAGVGVLVVGPSGSGKSLASLSALTDSRVRLLSDDLVVATGAGTALPFWTPIAVRRHHLPLLPDDAVSSLRREARQSSLMGRLVRLPGVRPLGKALRGMLTRRGDEVAAWARRVKTDHLAVPPDRLVPTDRRAPEINVEVVVLLEAAGTAAWNVMDRTEAVEAALQATYDNEDMGRALAHYAEAGCLDLEQHHRRATAAMEGTIGSARHVIRASVPRTTSIVDAQRWLLGVIEENLGRP